LFRNGSARCGRAGETARTIAWHRRAEDRVVDSKIQSICRGW